MSAVVHHLKRLPAYAKNILSALRFRARIRRHRGRPLILVDRFAGMGDVICSFPLLSAIRGKYPSAYIVFRTTAALKELPLMSGFVDEVVEDERGNDIPHLLRIREIDLRSYDFHFEPRHTTDPGVTEKNRRNHIVDAFCNQYGLCPVSRQPRLLIEEKYRVRMRDEMRAVRQGIGPILLIHCGPTWPVKEWTKDSWERLVEMFHAELDATVIQVGADWHYDANYGAVVRIPGAIHWVGSLSLTETAAAVAEADALIGVDSGLLHIAGAVGAPGVGLFGPTSPYIHSPPETPFVVVRADLPCLECHHLPQPLHWKTNCPHEIACMRGIRPEWALAATKQMLLTRITTQNRS